MRYLSYVKYVTSMESSYYYFDYSVEGVKLRFVKPYDYEYKTWCKMRWRDKPLYDVFSTEFKAYSADYYRDALETGKITISGKKVPIDYIIRNGECIIHKTIRQEPPVLATEIEIIHEDDQMLVVNKPSSMPVHASGAYHRNSLIKILQLEQGYSTLKPIHRLDRLTSGVVILAKSQQSAAELTNSLKSDAAQKLYVARVKGRFPSEEVKVNAGISCLDHQNGVYKIDTEGKSSETYFSLMKYIEEADESVIYCRPITGRTHQIRLHLLHLGHPIANDICYGGELKDPVTVPFNEFYKRIKLESGAHTIPLEDLRELSIWLHAYEYRLSESEVFRTSFPAWCNKDG
jgi:RluA family pseudouridine synthase